MYASCNQEKVILKAASNIRLNTLGSSTNTDLFVRFTLLARPHSTKLLAVVRKCCEAINGLPHDACADVKMLWSTKLLFVISLQKVLSFEVYTVQV